ncbi:hypothetical protein [uncultured Sphingomonas sp.]|uniref:hypothetical protein n=1 Tax=uncultured Sphingomonas sp. TaxID=158754 RepID=UPI0025F5B6A3|nr:hypothetical protein [uncultured Sphingomonas sp.]
MITIGIRAEPKGLTFAIFDSNDRRVLNVEEIRIPAAFTVPEGLKYVRSNLLDVLREYKVAKAGVRVTEPNAHSMSIARIQIEGVVQEAFASSAVSAYYVGQISSIAARLGLKRTDFKPLTAGLKEPEVENWSQHSLVEREAILCAMGAVDA